MGFFDRFRKKKAPKQVFTTEEIDATVFSVHLLMAEKCATPTEEQMAQVMSRHVGDTVCLSYDEKCVGLATWKYPVKTKEGKAPLQFFVTGAMPMADYRIDEAVRQQMWDCPESGEILERCRYHVCAFEHIGSALERRDRAQVDMDFLDALMELFPTCEAVYFQSSGKMLTREKIHAYQGTKDTRFIHFAVNARLFTFEGTNDCLIDTLGMSLLGLPDIQYHFHDFDCNWVVNHAYSVACYVFDGDKRIKDGDHFDGIREGKFDSSVRWTCHYENSIMKPERTVIDICMDEFAAGNRDYKQ